MAGDVTKWAGKVTVAGSMLGEEPDNEETDYGNRSNYSFGDTDLYSCLGHQDLARV
ncbi:hypothetical protein HH1059_14530 [Halorhodospira halochloris]|uniref:Uncharacterized protein n=1 Tax=Halorhodospira halochloris TaxID=1052 RepID=A0A2Z6EZN8_HALHR|nr:hypothetical protein HH1059_14530 [Halorhodospira halochloris]